jgi:hypothetical protein
MAKAPYSASAQALPHRMSRLFTEIRWILQVALGVFLLDARGAGGPHCQLGRPRRRLDV